MFFNTGIIQIFNSFLPSRMRMISNSFSRFFSIIPFFISITDMISKTKLE